MGNVLNGMLLKFVEYIVLEVVRFGGVLVGDVRSCLGTSARDACDVKLGGWVGLRSLIFHVTECQRQRTAAAELTVVQDAVLVPDPNHSFALVLKLFRTNSNTRSAVPQLD